MATGHQGTYLLSTSIYRTVVLYNTFDQDIMRLITRMNYLANRHDKNLQIVLEGWTAQPMTVSPRPDASLLASQVT
jgi:hypothetical protein